MATVQDPNKIRNIASDYKTPISWVSHRAGKKTRLFVGLLFPVGDRL